VLTAVVEQLVNLATPLVVVRAFGIGPDVLTTSEVLVAYGLVRLGAALTPVPAGIGVTELGLATLLTRFGGPDTEVLAAVLTYRAITFLLPLPVGAVSFVAWRWSRRVAGLGGGGVRGGPPTAAGLSSPGR
jgi:putative heme transporter